MKMKKIIIALLLVLVMLACLPVSATEERQLTLDRVIQISDTQLILEFSEPVAINLYGSNRGPYCVMRIRKPQHNAAKVEDGKYQGNFLQWDGALQYVDNKHDRLIWTMTAAKMEIETITDILQLNGWLEIYRDTDYVVSFTVEEVPFDQSGGYTNNAIDNITTEDGEVYLLPTRTSGYEGVNKEVIVDYSYKVDLSHVESVARPETYDYDLMGMGTEQTEETAAVIMTKNDPLIVAVLLGGGLLVGAACVVIGVVVRRKRKVA